MKVEMSPRSSQLLESVYSSFGSIVAILPILRKISTDAAMTLHSSVPRTIAVTTKSTSRSLLEN